MAQPSNTILLHTSRSSPAVRVHPAVLLTVCDAYIRRGEKQERVIGTLLGNVSDGVLEVKSCYVVPHNENSDQVAVDINLHKTMLELHQRVSLQEVVVGWFATGSGLHISDALLQEFYNKESSHPLHLVIDTTLAHGRFSVRAFSSKPLALGDKPVAAEFLEVPVEVVYGDAERVAGIEGQTSSAAKQPANDSDSLSGSLHTLQDLMDKVYAYVDDVVEGRQAADPALGRYLADTLSAVPQFSSNDFERLFNENVQDVMLVSYLSNLLRTHVALADKLGTASLPIL